MSVVAAAHTPDTIGAPVARRFYARMSWVMLGVGLLGFAPTYWVPLLRGTLQATPLTHLHALLFYGWLLLLCWQATLVAQGRTPRHREVGVAGVSLATAMIFVGLAMAVQSLRAGQAAGFDAAARSFAIVPVSGALLFAGMIGWAILNVRRPEVHKRVMLVATAGILQAAVGRWFVLALGFRGVTARPSGPPPVSVSVGSALAVDLLVVAMMVQDRRTHGRVHPTYWIAGGLLLAVQLLRVPVSGTSAWMEVTDWLLALAP